MSRLPVQAKIERNMPATNYATATLNEDYTDLPRGFIPTGDGIVQTVNLNGVAVAIPVKGGAVYPIQIRRINDTSTGGPFVLLY